MGGGNATRGGLDGSARVRDSVSGRVGPTSPEHDTVYSRAVSGPMTLRTVSVRDAAGNERMLSAHIDIDLEGADDE